jgi:hypothetical protein
MESHTVGPSRIATDLSTPASLTQATRCAARAASARKAGRTPSRVAASKRPPPRHDRYRRGAAAHDPGHDPRPKPCLRCRTGILAPATTVSECAGRGTLGFGSDAGAQMVARRAHARDDLRSSAARPVGRPHCPAEAIISPPDRAAPGARGPGPCARIAIRMRSRPTTVCQRALVVHWGRLVAIQT